MTRTTTIEIHNRPRLLNRKRRNRQPKGDITYRALLYYFYSCLVYLLANEYKCRYELLKVLCHNQTFLASNLEGVCDDA